MNITIGFALRVDRPQAVALSSSVSVQSLRMINRNHAVTAEAVHPPISLENRGFGNARATVPEDFTIYSGRGSFRLVERTGSLLDTAA